MGLLVTLDCRGKVLLDSGQYQGHEKAAMGNCQMLSASKRHTAHTLTVAKAMIQRYSGRIDMRADRSYFECCFERNLFDDFMLHRSMYEYLQ